MHTLVIGCGASGAAAAIAAAERGDRVTVLERNRKPLKKLGVTGNGRGNVLNSGSLRYYGREDFARVVLQNMPYPRLTAFLQGMGVALCQEGEGRVYPAAGLASVVTDAFLLRMEDVGISVHCNIQVTSLEKADGKFVVQAVESTYAPDKAKAGGKIKKGELLTQRPCSFMADKVIVAAGGQAAPAHGTDGSAYALLTKLGHRLVPPRPALCALLTRTEPLRGLSGQRVRAALTLTDSRDEVLHTGRGEALFAEDGVSGIAAMQLARFVIPGCLLRLDLRESLLGDPSADAESWLKARGAQFPERPLGRLFTGMAVPALAKALLAAAELGGPEEQARPLSSLTQEEWAGLAQAICCWTLPVIGTRGFEAAQVTAGGIDPADFDPQTMESKLLPGLYAVGEVLDVDGDCGGYNLMFAFACGLLAGQAGRD